jgi:hypothetical protein
VLRKPTGLSCGINHHKYIKMSTKTISITGTFLYPFNASNFNSILNGGYLHDPLAHPLSFYYTTTAFGGLLNSTYIYQLSGGELELYYNDLFNNEIILEGDYIFCETCVIFDLSNFDQTESKILKIDFYPENGDNVQTYSAYISNNQINYPILSSIKTTYYPSKNFYTYFKPKFKIYYESGNIVNLCISLTSVQCGIYESYKNKKIVDNINLYKNPNNVLFFVNDITNDDFILLNVLTSEQFEIISQNDIFGTMLINTIPLSLPFTNIPIQEITVGNIQIPIPPDNNNPVLPITTTLPSSTPTPTLPSSTPTLTPTPVLGIVTFTNDQIITFGNDPMFPF